MSSRKVTALYTCTSGVVINSDRECKFNKEKSEKQVTRDSEED